MPLFTDEETAFIESMSMSHAVVRNENGREEKIELLSTTVCQAIVRHTNEYNAEKAKQRPDLARCVDLFSSICDDFLRLNEDVIFINESVFNSVVNIATKLKNEFEFIAKATENLYDKESKDMLKHLNQLALLRARNVCNDADLESIIRLKDNVTRVRDKMDTIEKINAWIKEHYIVSGAVFILVVGGTLYFAGPAALISAGRIAEKSRKAAQIVCGIIGAAAGAGVTAYIVNNADYWSSLKANRRIYAKKRADILALATGLQGEQKRADSLVLSKASLQDEKDKQFELIYNGLSNEMKFELAKVAWAARQAEGGFKPVPPDRGDAKGDAKNETKIVFMQHTTRIEMSSSAAATGITATARAATAATTATAVTSVTATTASTAGAGRGAGGIAPGSAQAVSAFSSVITAAQQRGVTIVVDPGQSAQSEPSKNQDTQPKPG